MSDQKEGAGHHAITRDAVSRLFQHADQNGKILGLNENKFFETLDKWQKYADRTPLPPLAAKIIFGDNTTFGFGDTWRAANMDGSAQRKHSMADPGKSGAENLKDIRNFITVQLDLAKGFHLERDFAQEWQCLGAAAHAVEDSYSSAHAFRDPNNPTDPYAPIQAFNTFYWLNTTHDKTFDEVPVTDKNPARATDQAAAAAVAIIIGLYADHVNDQADIASQLFANEVNSLLQGENILVFTDPDDPQYIAQSNVHYQNEISFDPAVINFHQDSNTDQGSSSQQTFQPQDSQQSHAGDNVSLPDGTTTHYDADSSQLQNSQQNHADDNASLPDGTTIQYSADSSQADQSHHSDSNASLPDGTAVHYSADSQADQSHHSDSNASLPDGTTVHYSADSQADQSHHSDSNASLPDGTTVHYSADSQADQSHHSDSNASLPDGTTVNYGADSNQPDHSQQSQPADHVSSQPDSHQVQQAHDDGNQSMQP